MASRHNSPIGTRHAVPSRVFRAATALLFAALPACAGPVEGPAPQTAAEVYLPHPPDVQAQPWVEGLEVPWSLVFLPDGRALVSERRGRIRLIQDGRLIEEPYASFEAPEGKPSGLIDSALSLFFTGEGGLLGLAVHPRFERQPYIYAMHTYLGEDGEDANRVVRLRDEGKFGRFDKVIVDHIPAAIFHDGGRIAFGPDGMLYVTTGDASEPELAQNSASLAGKVLRVTPEGEIPQDNPFPGSPVWTLGHRNAQGLAWHPETGDLFATEHGPTSEFGLFARDEINVIRRGRNYGWPRVVGAPGLEAYEDPIVLWPDEAVPPAGAAFWNGSLFVATLESEALVRIALTREADRWQVQRIEHWFAAERAEGRFGRLRDATLGPDGALYFATSNRDGKVDPAPGDDRIYRLTVR